MFPDGTRKILHCQCTTSSSVALSDVVNALALTLFHVKLHYRVFKPVLVAGVSSLTGRQDGFSLRRCKSTKVSWSTGTVPFTPEATRLRLKQKRSMPEKSSTREVCSPTPVGLQPLVGASASVEEDKDSHHVDQEDKEDEKECEEGLRTF